jgi:hypothetical protein
MAQQTKVAESTARGLGPRLKQRQDKLVTLEHELKDATATRVTLAEHVETLGPAGQRADRDVCKQSIMTIRTLLLEHARRAFMAVLRATLPTTVSVEQVLGLLFARSGARLETPSQVIYWVNNMGLSLLNRRLMSEFVAGLSAMDLQAQGKPIHVRLKDMPP